MVQVLCWLLLAALFIVIEMIRRKPINPKKEGIIHTVGLVLLLLFMAIVSISDIIKVF